MQEISNHEKSQKYLIKSCRMTTVKNIDNLNLILNATDWSDI